MAFIDILECDFYAFDSLANLWITRLEEKPIIQSEHQKSMIINYLDGVFKKQGIAGLIVEDTETYKSLILLARKEYFLKQAFIHLQASHYFNVINDSALLSFVKRGIGLKLLS